MSKAFNLQDIENIEGEYTDPDEYNKSIQRAINSGMWALQGSYGRTMMEAIKDGVCLLGREQAADYFGNPIPSRDQVKPGTKGSYQYVADVMGTEYADMMAAV